MSYQKAIQLSNQKRELLNSKRFVKISERVDRSDLPGSSWQILLHNNYIQTWKGITLAKGVTEIAMYPMLLNELLPKTIIEIGAFNGGSAV